MIENIVSGDTLYFEYSVSGDYGPEAGYDFWLALRGTDAIDIKDGEPGVSIVSTGDTYEVTVTAATTATWTAGEYSYTVYTYDVDERYQQERGSNEILEDLGAQGAGYDGRSQYKKTLDAIDAVLEGRATKDQESYSIAGRSLSRTPIKDLTELRSYYYSLYRQEQRELAIENGTGTNRRVKAVLP